MVVTLALIIDLMIGIVAVCIYIFITLQQYLLYKKYPFQGLRFYYLGFFLATFPIDAVVLIMGSRILGLAETFKPMLILFYKIMFSIGVGGIGIFGIGLLAIRPRPEFKSWSYTQISIGALAGFTAGAIFTTLDFSWFIEPLATENGFRYGDIFIVYDFLVSLGMLALVILLAFVAIGHILHLKEIQRLEKNPTNFSTNWLPTAFLALIIAFVLLIFQQVPGVQEYQLALTFAIFLAICGVAFFLAFRKYPSLLAITSAKLSSLIINNAGGITIFAYDFQNKTIKKLESVLLLSGLLSAVNSALTQAVKSKERLASIKFKDKNVLSHSDRLYTICLITSEANPTIADLFKILVKRFEEQFGILIKSSRDVDSSLFAPFTEIVEDLIQFAPLSEG
ncbi:MAG: hypothetical protein ACFFDI_15425 [Promethearchaeota archaeon]